MSVPEKGTPAQTRQRLFFGFRAQAVTITLGVLIVGVIAISLLIERTIRASYHDLFQRQFTEQAETIGQQIRTDSDTILTLIHDATLNPRLLAALEIGRNDDYERFFYDAIESLRTASDSATLIAFKDNAGSLFFPSQSEHEAFLTTSEISQVTISALDALLAE